LTYLDLFSFNKNKIKSIEYISLIFLILFSLKLNKKLILLNFLIQNLTIWMILIKRLLFSNQIPNNRFFFVFLFLYFLTCRVSLHEIKRKQLSPLNPSTLSLFLSSNLGFQNPQFRSPQIKPNQYSWRKPSSINELGFLKSQSMPETMVSSAGGLLAMLNESHPLLKQHALYNLNNFVDQFWP
jgi:hypothetical protein